MQIVALAVKLAHTQVHVCCSPQHRRALLCRELQCLLVGAHGLAETTLRNPYIGQCDSAAECVGVVPGPPQTCHASGIRLMCGLEISARPPCQAKQRGRTSAPEMVVGCEVERPPRMLLGQGEIAQQQRVAGSMDRDRTRQTAE